MFHIPFTILEKEKKGPSQECKGRKAGNGETMTKNREDKWPV
jgi:hypothetical protein